MGVSRKGLQASVFCSIGFSVVLSAAPSESLAQFRPLFSPINNFGMANQFNAFNSSNLSSQINNQYQMQNSIMKIQNQNFMNQSLAQSAINRLPLSGMDAGAQMLATRNIQQNAWTSQAATNNNIAAIRTQSFQSLDALRADAGKAQAAFNSHANSQIYTAGMSKGETTRGVSGSNVLTLPGQSRSISSVSSGIPAWSPFGGMGVTMVGNIMSGGSFQPISWSQGSLGTGFSSLNMGTFNSWGGPAVTTLTPPQVGFSNFGLQTNFASPTPLYGAASVSPFAVGTLSGSVKPTISQAAINPWAVAAAKGLAGGNVLSGGGLQSAGMFGNAWQAANCAVGSRFCSPQPETTAAERDPRAPSWYNETKPAQVSAQQFEVNKAKTQFEVYNQGSRDMLERYSFYMQPQELVSIRKQMKDLEGQMTSASTWVDGAKATQLQIEAGKIYYKLHTDFKDFINTPGTPTQDSLPGWIRVTL